MRCELNLVRNVEARAGRSSMRSFNKGKFNGEDCQAIVEVFTELLFFDLLAEIAVGGGDDANIYAEAVGAAEALDFSLFEKAQNLDCNPKGSSPISSRNNVPPCAAWIRPMRDWTAPVNAPFV